MAFRRQVIDAIAWGYLDPETRPGSGNPCG